MPHATVLVVDDEELVRWSLGERLEHEGCEVVQAASVAEARARCEDGVDLVLLDCRGQPERGGTMAIDKPRRVPVATYRLQFNRDLPFERAIGLVTVSRRSE